MKIIALQKFYEPLIYFGLISINSNFNKLTIFKHYLTSIGPLGYYYHFSEQWTTFYDPTDNLPLDSTLMVSPNHAGHSFHNTFIMDVLLMSYVRMDKQIPKQ